MSSKPASLAIVAAALILSACSTSAANPSTQQPAGTSAATLPIAIATPPASTAPTDAGATPAPSTEGSAPPPAVDPCTLLTKDEASTLMGTKLGEGVATLVDKDRVCTWKKGSGLTEVKLLLAPQAPDAATAQAYWDSERAQVPGDFPVADVTGFDRAAYGNGTYQGAGVSALFVIHGTWFFDLFCGFPACSEGNSVTAANSIVGRLP